MPDSPPHSKILLVVSLDALFAAKLDAKLDSERAAGNTTDQWATRLVPPNLVAPFVREESPDVAIVDVDGWPLRELDDLRSLRQAMQGIPLIALRGSAAAADADEALLRAGVQEIVDRPFARDVILSNVLRRAEARRAAIDEFFVAPRDPAPASGPAASAQKRLRVVMHELVTPLTAIRLGTAALAARIPASRDGDEIETITRAAELMQRILRDLHAEQALEPERLLARKRILPHGLVDSVQQLLTPLAAQRRVMLTCSCGAAVPRVHADPDRLLEVLTNLVGNAIKFTPPGGRVDVSARPVQITGIADGSGAHAVARAIRIAVEDTGVGIPSDELPHVFEWFWHSRNVARGGAGLGLAIAKMLVDAHGSRLNVESVAGRGTIFWFDLPAAG